MMKKIFTKGICTLLMTATLLTGVNVNTVNASNEMTNQTITNASVGYVTDKTTTYWKKIYTNKKTKMKSKATKDINRTTVKELESTEKIIKGHYTTTHVCYEYFDYKTTKCKKGSYYKYETLKRLTNKIEEIHVDSYNKLNLHANVLKNTGKVGMAFAENDFKVIVRPDAEKSEFLPQEKLIVLHKDNKSEIYKQMGYFWNFLCDNIYDLNKAKYSVYKAEKKKIDSKLSEADYIAITYQMFVSKPKTLKNKCPKTYNFMYKYARELQQSQVEYAMFDYYNNHEYIVE